MLCACPGPGIREAGMLAEAENVLRLSGDGLLLAELLRDGAEITIYRDKSIGINRLDGSTVPFSDDVDRHAIARILCR